jgi:tol-pal system protein YbgF
MQADLREIQQDQRAVRALLADQQVAVEGLRRRVEILSTDKSDAGKRRASSPDVSRQLSDLEARVASLEQGRPAAQAGTPPGLEPPPQEGTRPQEVPPPPPALKAQNPQEAALAKEEAAAQSARIDGDYREGLGLVRQGQCAQANPKLKDFVRKNPKSDFADNALYWVGNCYYGQRDYSRAIVEFNDLVLKYPKGDKVPSALLTMADAFADSGDKIDARLVLQKLISQYPQAEEAAQARQKLQSLGE